MKKKLKEDLERKLEYTSINIKIDRGLINEDELIKNYFLMVYELTGRNKSKTAEILGLTRETIYQRLKRYGLY